MRRRFACIVLCCVVSSAFVHNAARATDVGFYFNASTELVDLYYPGNEFYGQVCLTVPSLNNLNVDVTAFVGTGGYDYLGNPIVSPISASGNFGIQKFGMNSTLITSEAEYNNFMSLYDISMPDQWGCQWGGIAGAFGKFEFWYTGTGGARMDPLSVAITPKDGAVIPAEYEISSASEFIELCPQGTYFTMHVAGISTDPSYWETGYSNVNSAFLGVVSESYVTNPVPEPGASLLLLAVPALAFRKRRH